MSTIIPSLPPRVPTRFQSDDTATTQRRSRAEEKEKEMNEPTSPPVNVNVTPAITQADLSKEDRALLSSLVESEQLGPAVKAVYDRQWQDTYQSFLSANIDKKNAQIRAICNDHYEEFISSVDNLLTVKLDITELKSLVQQLNGSVQDSGRELLSRAQALMEARLLRRNITMTIRIIRGIHAVCELAQRANAQIEQKKYFSALKTLDQLQRYHLPRYAGYEFAEHLASRVPLMILRIRDSCKTEFGNWLASIRERAREIGVLALTQLDEKMQALEKHESHLRRLRLRGLPLSERPVDDNVDNDFLNETHDDTEGLFDRIPINFAPVYQCLHIYETLHSADVFQNIYKEKRRLQAQQAVDMPNMGRKEFLESYTAYFAQLAGFFIIEDMIHKSGNELMSRGELDSMWELAQARVRVVLRQHLEDIDNATVFLQVKYTCLLLCRTLQSYGLVVTPLYEFLASMREKWETLLTQRLRTEIKDIFDAEKYEPLTITESRDYDSFVLQFGLQDASMNIEFPTTMPFSVSVPLFCKCMKNWITDYFEYASHLGIDMHAHIVSAVDHTLSREINRAITNALDHAPQLHISQAVQFSINASALADACNYFERYLTCYMDVTRTPSTSTITLSARQSFLQTRIRCEDLIFELIDNKIDAFLSLTTSIDWVPNTVTQGPREYVTDLIAYLETTFECMVFMPDAVREAVHFTSCKHISSSLVNLLLNHVKRFNLLAISTLADDVATFESFARRCPIPNLAETFSEIRQFIDLFLSGDVTVMTDDDERARRYPHLSPSKVIKLFEKFKDISMFSTHVPDALKRLKKKHVDAVMKRMITMQQQSKV